MLLRWRGAGDAAEEGASTLIWPFAVVRRPKKKMPGMLGEIGKGEGKQPEKVMVFFLVKTTVGIGWLKMGAAVEDGSRCGRAEAGKRKTIGGTEKKKK